MKSLDDETIQIYNLDKYLLTVTQVEQKTEQNNQVIEAKLDEECDWYGEGFEDHET